MNIKLNTTFKTSVETIHYNSENMPIYRTWLDSDKIVFNKLIKHRSLYNNHYMRKIVYGALIKKLSFYGI